MANLIMIHKHEESQIEFDLLICQEATKAQSASELLRHAVISPFVRLENV